ncbi:MAG: hypothetical protein J6X55_12785 [Victivallales bacterium]|nr:hypothetical protein [Victivallales bacterium]
MQKIIQIIIDNWEKCVLGLAIAIGILLCAAAAFFFQGELLEPPEPGKPLSSVRYFPWDEEPLSFLNPVIPDAKQANPFAKALANLLPKPQPPETPKTVEPPEPPKTVEPPKLVEPPEPPQNVEQVQEPPKPVEQPEQPQPAEQVQEPPKPEPPPKVINTITITYRGYYIDLSGTTIGMLAIKDSRNDSTQYLRLKPQETFLDFFSLANITENDITIQTRDGQLKTIPWNQKGVFEIDK